MLNWQVRYAPVVRILDHYGVRSVLDVGSGRHGISWFRSGSAVQTDLEFGRPITDVDREGTAAFVAADAAHLPFADRSFDAVISCDMVEHLPAAIRIAALQEVTRVARTVAIVGFPIGERAQRVDRAYGSALRLLRRSQPPWLVEHLSQATYPSAELVKDALPFGWSVVAREPSGNIGALFALALVESFATTQRMASVLDRRYRRRGVPGWWDAGPAYRTFFVLAPTGAVP